LAKPTDHGLEGAGSVIGVIDVPDKDSLGWSPAEHVFVHLDGQDMVKEFFTPATGPGEEASVIEFAATDVPLGSLLVDIDGHDTETFDLNELLSETEVSPELAVVAIPDEADSVQPAGLDTPSDAGLPDIAQMSVDLAFPPLTIVIDDESGSDTVAL
jgi:hypothetical protein